MQAIAITIDEFIEMCECLARLASIYNSLRFMLLHFGSRAKVVYYAWCFICVNIHLLVRCSFFRAQFCVCVCLLSDRFPIYLFTLTVHSFHHSRICFGSFNLYGCAFVRLLSRTMLYIIVHLHITLSCTFTEHQSYLLRQALRVNDLFFKSFTHHLWQFVQHFTMSVYA